MIGYRLPGTACDFQNLDPARPPLTIIALFSRHSDLYARDERLRRTAAAIGGRDIFVVRDSSLRNLDSPRHTIPPLHIDPILARRPARRIDDGSAKRSRSSGEEKYTKGEHENKAAELVE